MRIRTITASILTAVFLVSCISSATKGPAPTATVLVATATLTNTIKPIAQSQNENIVLDYALSANGEILAVYTNSEIIFYNTETSQKEVFFQFTNGNYSPQRWAGAIALSPDGTKVALSGKFEDTAITILDFHTKELLSGITEVPNGNSVYEMEFSPDSKTLFVRSIYPTSARCEASQDSFSLFAVGVPDSLSSKKLYEEQWCTYVPGDVRFTNDGKFFLYLKSMTPAYRVHVFDTNSKRVIQDKAYDTELDGNFYDVTPDGSVYAIATSIDGKPHTDLIDVKTGKSVNHVKGLIRFITNTKFLVQSPDDWHWSLQDKSATVCSYKDLVVDRNIVFSASRNAFALAIYNTEDESISRIQVWSTTNCELINETSFRK